MRDRQLRRLQPFCGLAVLASALSCGREPTAPRGDMHARLAWEPVFPSVMNAASGAAASGLASAVGLGSTKIRATSGVVTGTAELNVRKNGDDHDH